MIRQLFPENHSFDMLPQFSPREFPELVVTVDTVPATSLPIEPGKSPNTLTCYILPDEVDILSGSSIHRLGQPFELDLTDQQTYLANLKHARDLLKRNPLGNERALRNVPAAHLLGSMVSTVLGPKLAPMPRPYSRLFVFDRSNADGNYIITDWPDSDLMRDLITKTLKQAA